MVSLTTGSVVSLINQDDIFAKKLLCNPDIPESKNDSTTIKVDSKA